MADIKVGEVIAGATGLMLAGQWQLADRLLAAVSRQDTLDKAATAVARAKVAVERDMWCAAGGARRAIEAAGPLVAATGDDSLAYDLGLLRLRSDYWAALFPEGSATPSFGPEGHDTTALDDLATRGETARRVRARPLPARLGRVLGRHHRRQPAR